MPRPQAEAPLARRTAIVAFAFFVASALALAVLGVSLATLQRAFPLYALGGFGILIFGTSRLLVAGMAGRDVMGGASSAVATVAPAALGATGLFLAPPAAASTRVAFAALWAVAALAHAVVLALTLRRAPTRPAIEDPTATRAARVPLRLLEAGALAYAAASGLLVPLAYAGRVALASALHVVLVGFVIVTIMATASHILPRFTRVRAPMALLWMLPPFALAGPALMAAGLHASPALLPAGAIVEGLAFALFAAMVAAMVVRAHRFRWPNLGYAAAPVAIGVGGLLALAFATRGAAAGQLATHGLLNVYGFVGLFVMAASTDLYGPALGAGAAPARRHAVVAISVVLGALLVAAVGTALGRGAWARLGMLAYAFGLAWQLAGIVSAHVRAGRVVSRLQRGGRGGRP